MILGLEDGKVALVPHDEAWEKTAADMIQNIRSIMKEDVLDIQHVGGTSIRCAWAKPIIDLMVLVPDFSVIEKHLPELADLGIEYVGEILPRQHLSIIRTPDQKGQTFHIHFAAPSSEAWEEFLNIRDFCNSDPLGGKVYSDSKLLYAKGNEELRLSYREEKNNLYVVLRQRGQAMRAKLDGKKKDDHFIDDLFIAMLNALETPAFVYSSGKKAVRYKELAGLLARCGVRLKERGLNTGDRFVIARDDIKEQLALILAAAFTGYCAVLTSEESPEHLEEVQKRTGAKLIVGQEFFDEINSVREHLKENEHNGKEEVLLFSKGDTVRSVSFQELSSAVKTGKKEIKDSPDYPAGCDRRIDEEEDLVSMLSCLCAGGVITIG